MNFILRSLSRHWRTPQNTVKIKHTVVKNVTRHCFIYITNSARHTIHKRNLIAIAISIRVGQNGQVCKGMFEGGFWALKEFQRQGATRLKVLNPMVVKWAGDVASNKRGAKSTRRCADEEIGDLWRCKFMNGLESKKQILKSIHT